MVGTKHVKEIGIIAVVALSQINNALSSNITLCDELLVCIEIITGAPVDLRGVEKDEFCDALLSNIYNGNERAVTAICDVAALIKDPCEDCGHYDDNTTETTILAAPTCLPKATVVYADDSGVDTGYDIAVASIVGTFIDNGKRSRTNDDAVGRL